MFKQPLLEIKQDEDLFKIDIPKDKKHLVRKELRKLGYSRSKIYPDLNSIASEIDNSLFE